MDFYSPWTLKEKTTLDSTLLKCSAFFNVSAPITLLYVCSYSCYFNESTTCDECGIYHLEKCFFFLFSFCWYFIVNKWLSNRPVSVHLIFSKCVTILVLFFTLTNHVRVKHMFNEVNQELRTITKGPAKKNVLLQRHNKFK